MIGRHHAEYLEEQLKHGGRLLWIRTWDAAREKEATEILKRHSGRDVHADTEENPFAKLKDWRRIATRYDRCSNTFFLALV
jgi:hypothetical protein